MNTQAAVKAQAAQEPFLQIKGHVDAVEHGRVFGWAWSPEDPQVRLDIVLRAGRDELARVVADKPRIDLRRNAVGDGAHAFDLAMPSDNGEQALTLVACHPSGQELELVLPGDGTKGLPAVASSAFGIALDRIDFLITRLHRLQSAHHALTKQMQEGAGAATQPAADATETTLDQRLTEIDAVLMRLDRTLADFDTKLQLLSRKHLHGVAPQLLGLAGLVGLVIGMGVTLAFGR